MSDRGGVAELKFYVLGRTSISLLAVKGPYPLRVSRGKRVVPGKRDVPHQIKSLIT
jgi:hypothetical protein